MPKSQKSQDTPTKGLPFPQGWEKTCRLRDGTVIVLRPVIPEDEALYENFMKKNTAEDIRHRFFESMHTLPHDLVVQLTHVDYDRTMAFVALDETGKELLGVARYVADPGKESSEFTAMTRSDLKGQGIGFLLMQRLVEYAGTRRLREAWVQIMRDNTEMVQLCTDLGFHIGADETDPCCVRATRPLEDKSGAR